MKFLVFVLSCASVLAVAYGLQCYTCHPNSQSGKHCTGINEAEKKTCNAGEQFCLTIKLDEDITRDCFLDTQGTKKEGCRERGTTSECYCSGDFCNSATKNIGSISATLVLLPIAFSWFLAK